jgi:opacity protein-like surface antigen
MGPRALVETMVRFRKVLRCSRRRRAPLCRHTLRLGGLAVLALAALSGHTGAEAQQIEDRKRNTRFSFLMLGTWGGHAAEDDVAAALINAGFDDDHHSDADGLEFEIGYEHPSAWGVAVTAGRLDFGSGIGYRATSESGEEGESLYLGYSLRHISPTITYRLGPLRTSLGPSFVQTRAKTENWTANGQAREKKDVFKVGVEASAGASTSLLIPAFQVGVRARYRLVGKSDFGSFAAYDGALENVEIGFTQWQVGVGIGLRLAPSEWTRKPLPLEVPAPGSFTELGRLAGTDAAGSRGTWPYKLASALGGVPIGIWGPCADQSDCLAFALSGAAVVGVTSFLALLSSDKIPPDLENRIRSEAPAFQDAYRTAYRQEVRRRRIGGIVRGTLTGALGGLALILLSLSAT